MNSFRTVFLTDFLFPFTSFFRGKTWYTVSVGGSDISRPHTSFIHSLSKSRLT
nr:MAG TPA: HLA class I histocompatibility antigen E3-19K-HLA-A2 complex, unique tertiary.95A [Caudoviricetes sp.]